MKRFTRYYRDPAFKADVDRQFELAKLATRSGVWITYAIHDPSRPDHIEGRVDGLIVYVGQTKDFSKRLPKRMRSAGSAIKRPTDRIDGLLYDIMSNGGPAPRWSILEEVTTAIDSLASETNWARRLLAKGYPITNQWAEHKLGPADVDRHAVPTARLWAITAADALGSCVDVIVRDPGSGEELVVDLTAFPPATRLEKIKAHARAGGKRARLFVRSIS